MVSIFENIGGTYAWNGDYQIPNLTVMDKPTQPIGKYGMMRMRYLQEHRQGLYQRMVLSGNLYAHLEEVDQTCSRRMDSIIHRMAENEGVTEVLKATNQLRWVGLMNNFRHCAEEIVLNELVYG